MLRWLLPAVLAVAYGDWKCTFQEQNRCIINAAQLNNLGSASFSALLILSAAQVSAQVSGPLVFDGNVLVTHQAAVRSETSFSIQATGNVTVEQGSSLHAKGTTLALDAFLLVLGALNCLHERATGDLLLNASTIHLAGVSAHSIPVAVCTVLYGGT